MSATTPGKPQTTVCQCWGGSTHGTDDPSVRLCDLCGGTVPTDPASGNYLYLPRATGPAQQQTTALPPMRYDPSARRMSYCQAWEDGCEYEHCPRWRDGNLISEAHCTLDMIGADDE